MDIDAESVAQLVLLIGAISGAAVAIIKALKENTQAVKVGNEQAAVADAKKIELSEKIAEPVAPPPAAVAVAVTPEPDWAAVVKGLQELTETLKALPPR